MKQGLKKKKKSQINLQDRCQAYIIKAERCGFMLLDPLEQVSSTTVLHDNAQEAVSWKNRATLPNLHRNKVIISCPDEFKVSWCV